MCNLVLGLTLWVLLFKDFVGREIVKVVRLVRWAIETLTNIHNHFS